jgi:hypothetical protein
MRLSLVVIREMKGEGDKEVKDEESRDIWYEAPKSRPIQNVTYLRNYEATDLWKVKRTLLLAVKRETSEIAQLEY